MPAPDRRFRFYQNPAPATAKQFAAPAPTPTDRSRDAHNVTPSPQSCGDPAIGYNWRIFQTWAPAPVHARTAMTAPTSPATEATPSNFIRSIIDEDRRLGLAGVEAFANWPGQLLADSRPPNDKGRPPAPFVSSSSVVFPDALLPLHHSRSRVRSRAIDWLCSWQTRDSVTLSTAAISLRFMSCS